jgi:hypothetical protein
VSQNNPVSPEKKRIQNELHLLDMFATERATGSSPRLTSGHSVDWPVYRPGQKYFLIPSVSDASFQSSNREDAGVAQLVEHFLAKEDVASSSLVTRSPSSLA